MADALFVLIFVVGCLSVMVAACAFMLWCLFNGG